jgi:hypothetical protein
MNYSEKLGRLQRRRQGFYTKEGTLQFSELGRQLKNEKFEAIDQPKSVKYALGAMQAVDNEYTSESYAEGNRVATALKIGLSSVNIPISFEFQGSVPLDVHVRGNSDVDLLALHSGFVTHDENVLPTYSHHYSPYAGDPALEELKGLREQSIDTLKRRYWGSKVDSSKSKAITLSEGAFTRVVDVVPSHWHDTLYWKQTNQQCFRGIYVLDSHSGVRIHNKPFLHIKLVQDKCNAASGALRKIIRLLKNLKYDADTKIDLASYDIAAIAWNMTETQLFVPYGVDLLLVERARACLEIVTSSEQYRNSLWVPDGSRKIFDRPEKISATRQLGSEIDRLAKDIHKELDPLGALYNRAYYPASLNRSVVYG